MAMKCPKCSSAQFYYVQASIEYHSIEEVDVEAGAVYCNALEESVPMDNDQFEPYLVCENDKCMARFNTDLTEKE